MFKTAVSILCLMSLLTGLPAVADTHSGAQERAEKLKNLSFDSKKDTGSKPARPGESDPMLPESPESVFADQSTLQAYRQSLKAYYGYRQSGLEHRSKVFQWQLLSAKLIFVVVLILVAAGIYFAAVQFHYGMKRQNGESMQTELSATTEGLKVSSPVLGVIILVISLAFFYLYLVYVYPIEDIF
ncbi:MAG: hypothetical protein ACU84J_15900 [Gammaproteobacteria bacterium]